LTTPGSTDGRLLDLDRLTEYLGISKATAYNLMGEGLPSLKVGAQRRFRLSEVDEWLDARRTGGAA